MFSNLKPAFGTSTSNTTFGFTGMSNVSNANPFGQPTFGKTTVTGFSNQPATPFGQQPAPLFGSTATQHTPLFGSQQTSTFGQPATQTSAFGTGMFGTPSSQPTGTSLFGNSNASFGQQNKTTGFGFGTAPSNTSFFGQQANPVQQQQTPSLFGQNTSTNLFGQNQGFGNVVSGTPTGTIIKFQYVTGTDTMVKGSINQTISTRHHCITCMKEYEGKSLEELRWEDYQANRKGPQGNQPSTGLFGTGMNQPVGAGMFGAGAIPASGTNLFGQTENKSVFGSSAPSAFGQSGTFGATQTSTAGSNLFAKPLGFGTTTSSASSAFAFNPSASTNLFGSQNNKPFGQTAPTTNLFGQQPATGFGAQTPFGSFGTTNNQNTSLFQQKATMPFSMGVNTSSTGFGAFSQPGTVTTQSGLFTGVKPNPTFGAFGPTSTATPMFGGNTFGQASQPLFNTSFNKPAPSIFGQNNQAPTANLSMGAGQNLFGAPAQKPGSLFGSTPGMFNTGFGVSGNMNNSFMMTGPGQQQQQGSLMSVPQNNFANNEQQMLAMAAMPFGLSPFLADASEHTTNANIEEMARPTNQHEIKQLLATVTKPACGESTVIKNKLTPKQLFGRKVPMFEGLEEKESYNSQYTFKMNSANPKRLMLRNKDKYKINQDSDINLFLRNQDVEDKYSVMPNSSEERMSDNSRASLVEAKSSVTLEPKSSSKTLTFNDESYVSLSQSSSATEIVTRITDYEAMNDKYEDAQQYLDDSQSEDTFCIMQKNDDTAEQDDLIAASLDGDDQEENLISIVHSKEPHPTGIILTRAEYYTKPTLDELINYIAEDGSCVVQGFTIGRIGYGNVRFTEAFDVSNLNIDELVFFRDKEINIYPDESKKPPIGQGLNRKAQVTLDKVWPYNKKKKCVVRDIEKLVKMDYADRLRNLCEKQNTRFIEYRPDTGSWVFRVEHFSKYGRTDSDESDEFEDDSDNEGGKPKEPGDKMKKKVEQTKDNSETVVDESTSTGSDVLETGEIRRANAFNNGNFLKAAMTGHLLSSTPLHTPRIDSNVGADTASLLGISPLSDVTQSTRDSTLTDKSSSYYTAEDDDTYVELGGQVTNLNLSRDIEIPKVSLMKSTFFGSLAEYDTAIHSPSEAKKMRQESFWPEKTPSHTSVHVTEVLDDGVVSLNDLRGMMQLVEGEDVDIDITLKSGLDVTGETPPMMIDDESPEDIKAILAKLKDIPIQFDHCFADAVGFKGLGCKIGWSRDMTLVTNSLNGLFRDDRINIDGNIFEQIGIKPFSADVHAIKVRNREGVQHKEKVNNLREQLHCQLRNSKYTLIDNLPSFQPESGYALLEANKNLIQNIFLNTKENEIKYECDVWSLCNALWGNMDEQDVYDFDTDTVRKKQVGEWLKDAVHPSIEKSLTDLRKTESLNIVRGVVCDSDDYHKDKNVDSNMFKILTYLSGHMLEEAATTALSTGSPHMSLYICQLPLTVTVKSYFLRQLQNWQSASNVDGQPIVDHSVVKIYMLLAGIPSFKFPGEDINICEGVDWLRAFAMYYWYLHTPATPINEIVTAFEDAFNVYQCAASPTPHYNNDLHDSKDLMFHLLKYYCDVSYPMNVLLNPVNHTGDHLDFSLSWFLLQTFTSLGLITYSNELHQQICLQFCAQLENMDMWHWAIFVALYLKDVNLKNYMVNYLLHKHIKIASQADAEYEEKEDMLVKDFHLPPKWIDSAKADIALEMKKYNEAVHYLKFADRLDEMHKIMFKETVPEQYIAFDYDYLSELLKDLEGIKEKITNWESTGQFVKNLIELHNVFGSIMAMKPQLTLNPRNLELHQERIKHYEHIKSLIMNMSFQFSNFPNDSYVHNICLNEMSCRVLEMIRTLFRVPLLSMFQNVLNQNEDGAESRSNRDNLVRSLIKTIDDYILTCNRQMEERNEDVTPLFRYFNQKQK